MVVRRRLREWTGASPVLSSAKQPVPYVDFIMPGLKQPCPTVAACWSPAIPRMLIGPPNRSVVPKSPALSHTFGSKACGTPNSSQSSPSHCPLLMSSSSVRAALVASVACTWPPVSRQSRNVSIVPKASRPARAFDMVEEPGDLRGREIGIEQQSRALRDHRLVAGLLQRRAGVGRAAILPDNRIVDRPATRAIPHHRGLALIGDSDRCDMARGGAGLRERGAHSCDDARPDLLRIVLDMTRRRIDLAKLLLCNCNRHQRAIEQDGAARGRALIDREKKVSHALMLR